MSADKLTPAVIGYIDHGVFPQDEAVATATLTSTSLEPLLQELQKAQNSARDEIRTLSRQAAPDVDAWFERAKALQKDILRSRETARQIVAEAEAGKALKSAVEDAGKKVELLEKEVLFNETLTGTLEHVRFANRVLEEAKEASVQRRVGNAVEKLEEAEESIQALRSVQSSSAFGVLERRAEAVREGLMEVAKEAWDGLSRVDGEERSVVIRKSLDGDGLILENLVDGLERLGIFEGLVKKLAKDLERAVFRSRMIVSDDGTVPRIKIQDDTLSLDGRSEDTEIATLLQDLITIFTWLAQHLPSTVSIPLSDHLVPATITRLEDDWLESAIPLEIADMASFQVLLDNIFKLADTLDQLRWNGSSSLREWMKTSPRTWLTKRRETLLGDVRNLVFTGLRERKTVERIETHVVGADDELAGSGDANDEWDTAWDDPEEEKSTPQTEQPPADDDDDTSAWDVDTEAKPSEGGDEEDAWGWGDGDDNSGQKPSSPVSTNKPASKVNGERSHEKPKEREVTLREEFTVTGLPDSLIELIQQVIADAQTLAGPEYASSLIAPVATALYSLPTLALAIFRATAPTAYSKLDTGNMLIYNDTSRLSDRLRAWQASQPASSRLRLDNDVKSLDQFSKRAYTAEMESQRTILRDLLDGAQGFSNCTTNPFKAECESAVEGTVHRLREVHRQWSPILSPSALSQSIGSLVASVTGKMITDIEDLPDIGEEESRQLKALCDTVSEVKDLFVQTVPESGEQRDLTFIYCPNWLKFQYLAEILDSRLADVKYLWHEGELSLEFEAEEVVGLIEALFVDNSLRRGAIGEIRRGGRR